MIVMGADEGVERDKAIAARTILYHHRLAPTPGQTIDKQTGCGIAGAGRCCSCADSLFWFPSSWVFAWFQAPPTESRYS